MNGLGKKAEFEGNSIFLCIDIKQVNQVCI